MGKPSSEKLVASINASAHHVGAATLTFLAVCVYVGIAVASTEDEVLLLGTNIGLPLFDVQIPLDKFYVLAPALLVFLHLHLLLLQFLLVSKVVKFCQEDNPPEEETDLFFPSLPISILLGQKHPGMVRFLLWLLLFTITIALPIGLLIATQVRFLPHHSTSITAWHKCLILFDLALIWYFHLCTPSLPSPEEVRSPADFESHIWSFSDPVTPEAQSASRPWKSPLENQIFRSLGRFGALALTVATIGFSVLLVGGSEIGGKVLRARINLLTRAFSENLTLVESKLINGEIPEVKGPSPDHPRGVRLTERDLREANFTHAVLINADLRGADLTRTNFEKADLRFAKLSPSKGMEGVLEMLKKELSPETIDRARKRVLRRRTRLQGSRLREADLRDSNLFMADLRGADLGDAKLDGADLRLADLRGADLRGASLRGALLTGSILNLADLRKTDMFGADLARASLLGADLWRAKMTAANLKESDLRGAKLVEVEAMFADFSAAKVDGGDFQNAWLNAATGLALLGVDLRGAHIIAADLCTNGSTAKAADLRFIHAQCLSQQAQCLPENWGRTVTDLQSLISKQEASSLTPLPARLLKVKDLIGEPAKLNSPPCLIKPDEKSTGLYYESPAPGSESWPISTVTERAYHDELAMRLVEQACNSHELTQVLLRELAGESVPRRRLLAVAIARRIQQNLHKDCQSFQRLFKEQRQLISRTSAENPLSTDD